MLRRAFASFLVVLLVWSALATQEHAIGAGGDEQATELSVPQGRAALPGSIDEHHLDDQPVQMAVEPTLDLPTWFPATFSAVPGRVTGAPPAAAPAAARLAFAAGAPDRPPRG